MVRAWNPKWHPYIQPWVKYPSPGGSFNNVLRLTRFFRHDSTMIINSEKFTGSVVLHFHLIPLQICSLFLQLQARHADEHNYGRILMNNCCQANHACKQGSCVMIRPLEHNHTALASVMIRPLEHNHTALASSVTACLLVVDVHTTICLHAELNACRLARGLWLWSNNDGRTMSGESCLENLRLHTANRL